MGFQNLLWVFIGGGLGSTLRYLLSKGLNPMFTNVFIGTLTVNLIGSLLIGFFIGFEAKSFMQKPMFLFLTVGFCGGFTTFSAFAAENLNFLKSGEYFQALIYSLVSVLVGILSVGLGFYLAKQL